MKKYVKIILTCLGCFCIGFILGLKSCRSNVQPLSSKVIAERNAQEVSSEPKTKVNKTQSLVSVSQTVNTERYGKITTETVFQRKDFDYNHCLAVNAFALNSEVLLGFEYRYKKFKIHTLAGYHYKEQSFSYGLGIGYVIKKW